MKKILITGVNSYIGTSVKNWLNKFPDMYYVETISVRDSSWLDYDFSKFDVVFHTAGIVHNMKKNKNSNLYYQVNRDLTLDIAKKAKESGVNQFIFMSSMSVYNGRKYSIINNTTVPISKGMYSDSKLQAEVLLQNIQDSNFKVAIVRPPMIFGPNCKGNFPRLVKLSMKLPFFPNIDNKRSMIFIDNFCEFIRLLIDSNNGGVYFPQNENYYSTTEIVKIIAKYFNKKIYFTKLFNIIIYLTKNFIHPIDKMFGNLVYDKSISKHFDNKYIIVNNYDSIIMSIKNN